MNIHQILKEAISTSELIKGLEEVRERVAAQSLSPATIKKLEENGNYASDWSKVKVTSGFNPGRVKNSCFYGEVILGKFEEEIEVEKEVSLSSGIYNSTLINCRIGNNTLIKEVRCLANYVVRDRAVLFNLGVISTEKAATFANGIELPLAIETGGREVKTYAEITVEVAEKLARSRGDKKLLSEYERLIKEYLAKVTSDKGIISEGAVVKNTPKVLSTYIGPYGVIENASTVINVTMLSSKDEPTKISDGAYVKDSILQWSSQVTSLAIVTSSVLTEHSHVERHGKVTDSILGPNSGVGEGEITASLVGPFVGFHHQALLIAAFWPEGKGNVSYGANVGSNHTGKAPDQEIFCGEGVFFGLGCNIKFPSNFRNAPYSLIASVVDALPQKVEFPFSLINTPAHALEGVSPALNEIIPAWVLSDNLYMIRRNEAKYKKRNKAKRSKIIFDILRTEIIDLMIEARRRLLHVKEVKQVYTQEDIPGLGKNYLLEINREKAIETYTFFIRYYALIELKKVLEKNLLEGISPKEILSVSSFDSEGHWEHARQIISKDFPSKDIGELLKTLLRMEEKVSKMVEESKEKDDVRGEKIIDDYSEVHISASDDPFVQETRREVERIRAEIHNLFGKEKKW